MADGLHIHIRNRTMKPLTIALSGVGGSCGGWREAGDNLTNVQCKPI
jgi:hypothetical protein